MSDDQNTTDDTELLPEAEFAQRLGIERELVRETRIQLLTEGEHWMRGANGLIMLRPEGAELLLDALAVEEATADGEAVQTEAEPVVLIVVRQVANAYQVLARRPEDDPNQPPPIVLAVPIAHVDGKIVNFFTPGIAALSQPVKGARWEYVGPRPRFRGDPCLRLWKPVP